MPRQRLAYDELLAGQLALALVRRRSREMPGRAIIGDGSVRARIIAALPFTLTASQVTALGEIERDLGAPSRMLRLLQGDVGSGKTVVALMAMGQAIEAGAQAALMAPTEVLARQHHDTIAPLALEAGLRIGLLTGRDKGKARRRILQRLASGDLDIVVGTHALFQDEVAFKDLALAVIDEQHRFGVQQRLALQAKGGPTMVSPVIALHDLRTGSDAEINRLEDREASLTAEIGNLRQENQKLILDNQNLRSELLEIKLVLSRVQIDELRGLEKVNSWLRSFKMLL